MYKTLVTGAAGFVGRHIVKHLLERGDQVHAVDSIVKYTGGIDPAAGWPLFNPNDFNNFHYHRMDCRNYFRSIDDDDFDYAFHLAAMVGGREMIENNPLAVAEDLAIDAAFWQWAARTAPGKTVCFSSSAAYPVGYQTRENYCLLKEDMIDFGKDIGMPDMSYGWAKLTNEYLAKLAFERHGLKSVTYRPFSGYGEDQDDAYPFPSICKRALANLGVSELIVWGTGDQMRDFIHIDDCVAAIFQSVDLIDDGAPINLSTGVYTSFKEFAALAAQACGYNPIVVGMSDKPEGVFARAGDTAKQESLGIANAISFEEGVQRAIEYYTSVSDNLSTVI